MPTARIFYVEVTSGLSIIFLADSSQVSVGTLSLTGKHGPLSHGESQLILSSFTYMAGRKRWVLLDEIFSVVLLVLQQRQ